jgi:fatty-acyl-CoA synthase
MFPALCCEGVPVSSVPPEFRGYVEVVLDTLRVHPDRVVLVGDGRRITGGEFSGLVYQMARALRDGGFGPGSSLVLLSGNLPEVVAARYAANLIGAMVSHPSPGLSTEALADIVRDAEAGALVVAPDCADQAAEVARRVGVADVLVLGPAKEGVDFLDLASRQSARPLPGQAGAQDVAVIRYTGGVTGRPKGIPVTFAAIQGRKQAWTAGRERERLLVCTPLAHLAGIIADQYLAAGALVVLRDHFDAEAVLATVQRERITGMLLVPSFLYQLLDHPDLARHDFSSVRTLLYAGTQASPHRIAEAVRRFGPVLVNIYAQTETRSPISVLRAQDHDPDDLAKLRSVGKPVPGVRVAIRDHNGRDLPAGEHGEIWVQSPTMMSGYWKQPELTATVLRDGWLRTGDIGFLDAQGYLTLTDRLVDLIVVGANHVSTSEVEDVLNTHPAVLQSAVFGVSASEGAEEHIHAAVVPRPGGTVDEHQLREFVRARQGPVYVPAHIAFTDTIPLTPTGKPDKKQLRAAANPV